MIRMSAYNTVKGKLDNLTNLILSATSIVMSDVSTDITPTGAAIVIPAGYHDGTKHVIADADLLAENIKKGVTIYGVTGTYEG
jgi:hypothetical protein